VDLDGLPRARDRDLARVQLGDRRLGRERAPSVAEPRGPLVREPRRLDPHPHVGDLELKRLVRADRLPERLPLPRVPDALLQASTREPDRERRDRDAPVGERLEELRVPAAAFAEQVVDRHAARVERDLVGIARAPPDLAVARTDVSPGVPTGTTIVETSPSSAASSSAATMITDVSGVPELVMKAFEPSITHPSSSSLAVVWIARASEPPPVR
jgi:hypothetical protein